MLQSDIYILNVRKFPFRELTPNPIKTLASIWPTRIELVVNQCEKQAMSEQPTQKQMKEIEDALASGSKIEAIKIYREVTGKGLKESKEFVEALIPELQERDPEKYAKLSQGAGCVLVFVGFTTAALIWIVQSWA